MKNRIHLCVIYIVFVVVIHIAGVEEFNLDSVVAIVKDNTANKVMSYKIS